MISSLKIRKLKQMNSVRIPQLTLSWIHRKNSQIEKLKGKRVKNLKLSPNAPK